MTRSKMIEIIETILHSQRQDLNNGSDRQDAEAILDRLEDLGMLPPEYNVNEGSGAYKIPSYYINDWESEDE
jgi:hypothetical protein